MITPMEECLLKFDSPDGRYFVLVENDGTSCWAYLIESDSENILKDVFLYSPIEPQENFDKVAIAEGATPVLITKYASESAVIDSLDTSSIKVRWSSISGSFSIHYRDSPIAAIYADHQRGFSKALVGSSGFGEEWDENLYNQTFR